MTAKEMNETWGNPGTIDNKNKIKEVMANALGCEKTCNFTSDPKLSSDDDLVTTKPVAMAISSAGI
jgi:hypothetical protein